MLLVADDPRVSAHAPALEASGLVVAGVTGGARALVALQRARPHVVVLDAGLKGIGADELARALSGSQDALPVVCAGFDASSVERRAAAMAAGAADYFHLPAEGPLLIARTRQLVATQLYVERLRSEADRDYLTGLANRRRFRKALGQEVERWRRYELPCALVLIDVDYMKRINDTHGHPAGDRVIRSVADAIEELSRDNDTAARLGGEEFALLLAGAASDRALVAAERLRRAVREEVGVVTVSLGVASCPAHASNERELFSAADAALYRAKREGRDRAALADSLTTA